MLILAVAALAFPLGVLANHQFSDVPAAASYHDDVEALVNAGVTTGCGGGKYCPNDFVTRAQMAQFLNRLGSLDGGSDPSVDADTVDGRHASAFVRPLFAVINTNGSLARGVGVTSSANLSDGAYEVIFNRNVTGCAYAATLGDGSLGTYDGEVSATNRLFNSNGVFVETKNSAGTEANVPFHLVVTCSDAFIFFGDASTTPEANQQE
jgi:hypothetical protein